MIIKMIKLRLKNGFVKLFKYDYQVEKFLSENNIPDDQVKKELIKYHSELKCEMGLYNV